MHISNLKTRKKFYEKQFDISIAKKWLFPYYKNPVFAIDMGNETGIYLKKHKEKIGKIIFISRYENYEHLVRKFIFYLPEDIYYNRNIVKDYKKCRYCTKRNIKCLGCSNFVKQELVFDIDSENIKCKKCKREKIYDFCIHSLKKAKQETINLHEFLKIKYKFKKLKIVYSGRGYHIHVFDDRAFRLNITKRKKISEEIKQKFPIDPWVSRGHIDLIRLPGSLNALVSRVVTELTLKQIKKFDPLTSKRVRVE